MQRFIRCKLLTIKSALYTSLYVDNGDGKILFKSLSSKLIINKSKNAFFTLNGDLILEDLFHKTDPVLIRMDFNSTLKIDGDFILGNGVKIVLTDNAILNLGGRKFESGSGITGDSIIMVRSRVDIGVDFICSWNCFITDSDSHKTNAKENTIPVKIGNHVWFASNTIVLKGSEIADNTIVSTTTVVHNQKFSANQVLGGVPAKIIKDNAFWSRDLK